MRKKHELYDSGNSGAQLSLEEKKVEFRQGIVTGQTWKTKKARWWLDCQGACLPPGRHI